MLIDLVKLGNNDSGLEQSSYTAHSEVKLSPNTASKGMTEKEMREYAAYIKDNCKMIVLPNEETYLFVDEVINTYGKNGKQEALVAFDRFQKRLQADDPTMGFLKISFYAGVMNSNGIITEDEMNTLSSSFRPCGGIWRLQTDISCSRIR